MGRPGTRWACLGRTFQLVVRRLPRVKVSGVGNFSRARSSVMVTYRRHDVAEVGGHPKADFLEGRGTAQAGVADPGRGLSAPAGRPVAAQRGWGRR